MFLSAASLRSIPFRHATSWLPTRSLRLCADEPPARFSLSVSSIHVGAWSLAFSQPRTFRSTSACTRRARHLRLVESSEKRPVATGRQSNTAYRTREHLTEKEMAVLLDTLKTNRHGLRDWLIGLMIYRHGLRVSEACDLRWDDIDFAKRTILVRRLKGSHDSTHYLERDELPASSGYSASKSPRALRVHQ
jgi:integrase